MAPTSRRPDSEISNFPEPPPRELATLDELLNLDVNDPTGLEQSRYDFSYRIFPKDLTMQDNAHYMVININVPVHIGGARRSDYKVGTILNNEFSKVDNLRFGVGPRLGTGGILPGVAPQFSTSGVDLSAGTVREVLSIPRSTRRIAESIALHMPNGGLVYTEDNQYEPVSMSAAAGGLVSTVAGFADKFTGGLSTKITDAVGSVVTNSTKLAGYPINPRIEVLFSNRPQRQWMFELMLAPRSVDESYNIKKIIETLRYHAAPELGNGGFYFIPPAEFDITFFRQGAENLNLPRINTCVLERIDIDYAPQGGVYSTFRDGTPVAIRLSLGFREIEIVHKRRVLQGF